MSQDRLRPLFPEAITNGAFLLPDGSAGGVVIGGTPFWEMISTHEQAQIASAYHFLLLALEEPLDIYILDRPVDLWSHLDALLLQQPHVMGNALQAELLAEMIGRVNEALQPGATLSKQVVWVIRVTKGVTSNVSFSTRVQRRGSQPTLTAEQSSVLRQAVSLAQRLASQLQQLQGIPPHIASAETIAQLWYYLADPIRSQRYPLTGNLLDRVQRVMATTQSEGSPTP